MDRESKRSALVVSSESAVDQSVEHHQRPPFRLEKHARAQRASRLNGAESGALSLPAPTLRKRFRHSATSHRRIPLISSFATPGSGANPGTSNRQPPFLFP